MRGKFVWSSPSSSLILFWSEISWVSTKSKIHQIGEVVTGESLNSLICKEISTEMKEHNSCKRTMGYSLNSLG